MGKHGQMFYVYAIYNLIDLLVGLNINTCNINL